METHSVGIPAWVDLPGVVDAAERFACGEGLLPSVTTTLRKYPGSLHWHYKKAGQSGTLEVTLIPDIRQLQFSVQSGRRADWILPVVHRLIDCLREGFAAKRVD